MDVHTFDAVAPRDPQRFAEEPAAVALAGKLRQQTDIGKLALARLAQVQLNHANLGADFVDDHEKSDSRVLDDLRKPLVAHEQPREPQPMFPYLAEELAIL